MSWIWLNLSNAFISLDDELMSVDGDENDNEEEEKVVNVGDMPSEDSDNDSTYYDAIESETAAPPRSKTVSFLTEPSVSSIPPSTSSAKSCSLADKVRAAKEELQFPDEVETPFDVPARQRFAKYRGLPSFSKCVWPTENDASLPFEYSKIFR